MILRSLAVTGLRNLVTANYSFAPGLNIFIGANGQGKTSFIESFVIAASGRSFRTSVLGEAICTGAAFAQIGIVFEDRIGERAINVRWEHGTKRDFLVDGKAEFRASHLLGLLPFVMFSPKDLDLIRGGPQGRRNFLEKHLVDLDPLHVEMVVRYRRALRQKNTLLKSGSANFSALAPWNEVLAREGAKLWIAKRRLIASLLVDVKSIYKELAPSSEDFEIHFKSTLPEEVPAEDMEARCAEMLSARMAQEIKSMRCLVGPHRDELRFILDGREMRNFASQGQVRTAVLALKLATVRQITSYRGDPPVVFLDDVVSELDTNRVDALNRHLLTGAHQVFVTITDSAGDAFAGMSDRTVYAVHAGVLTARTAKSTNSIN